jgi:GT2 family glycosyltransferase
VTRAVEIILPVFNAAIDLRRCLDALLDRLPQDATVQVVDDASTEPDIHTLLRTHALCGIDRVRLFRNVRNLGFVRSVNAAMSRTTADVVLLNSDTIVTHGWLERILACAHSDPAIATITPFSNNAEICSLPEFCRANPAPSDPETFARAAVRAGPPVYPDLPTGVGFCMFIRRKAWESVGEFDAVSFGRGYGEENDWCFRAMARGWRNVLCDDAYVVHVGGKSFAETRHRPGGGQLERLLALHPHYNDVIADFIRRDPIAPRRQAVLTALTNYAIPG